MIQIGLESDRLLAMQRGDVSVFSPIITPVVKKVGMRILLDVEELEVPYLLTGHGTTRSFVEKHRPVVVRFMRPSILRSRGSKLTGHLLKKCSLNMCALRTGNP